MRKNRKEPVQTAEMPVQQPLTEEEIVVRKPSAVVRIFKRIGFAVLLVLAVVFAYLFLLLGEPDEEVKYLEKPVEESISMPMSALEIPGTANVQNLADTFGQPVLSLGDALTMQKARIYDTAFEGGYARRVTLTYALENGQSLTVESIRPTSAVTLLNKDSYRLDAFSLYTLGGLNAARMDNSDYSCVFGQNDTAVYAVVCPASYAEELTTLLRYSTLVAPNIGG